MFNDQKYWITKPYDDIDIEPSDDEDDEDDEDEY